MGAWSRPTCSLHDATCRSSKKMGATGKPPDDATAIRELERLRKAGASFIVFIWSTFWWLEYYAGLHRYLRAQFPCIQQDERIVVFDLRSRNSSSAGWQVM